MRPKSLKYFITIVSFTLFGSLFLFSQEVPTEGGGFTGVQELKTLYQDLSIQAIPLETPIDPTTYYLGPGDQLHVAVTSLENKLLPGELYDIFNSETIEYYVFVSPVGELVLPSIGKFYVIGKTYADVLSEIEEVVDSLAYKEVSVQVNLAGLRKFKVLVEGAVNYPGYVDVTPVSRLTDALTGVKGVQKYAHPDLIYLIRDGKKNEIRLKEFLLRGDLSQNPYIKERDIIMVPFQPTMKDQELNFTEYNTHQIIVHGFVRNPRGFSYVPGYRASDYISMVGGPLNIGNIRGTRIYRADGTVIARAYDEFVEPGDIVVVPEGLRSRLFGNISLLQTATAIATLILSYRAAVKP